MYKLSNKSHTIISGIKPVLIDVLLEGIKDSPFDFGIPEDGGLRTDQDQLDMFAIGRTVQLHRDPVTWTLNSYHKTGKAFDIFAYVDGDASWDMEHLEPIARHLQKIAMEMFCIKLQWGFDLWGKDGAHFQID
jgi:peptidoglycan L-alanyl-D-glutamate endopeptidase CwlK